MPIFGHYGHTVNMTLGTYVNHWETIAYMKEPDVNIK